MIIKHFFPPPINTPLNTAKRTTHHPKTNTNLHLISADDISDNKEGIKHGRDGQIDALKFLLMCSVVFGHVLMALNVGKAGYAMFNLIYSFHMPLFVFISGYFTHIGVNNEKTWNSTFHFLSLYVVFNALMWLAFPRDIYLRSFLIPQYAMWYLLSMFYWRFIAMWAKKEWITKRNLLLVVTFSALVGFMPKIGEILSFNRTACFLCFFMMGVMCQGQNFFKTIRKIPLWLALLPFVAIYILMLNMDRFTESYLYVYSSSYGTDVMRFVERCVHMIFALILGISFIRLSQVKMPRICARLGRKTLFFYLYHTFLISMLGWLARRMNVPADMWICILYTVIIMAFCSLFSNVVVLNKFLNINIFSKLSTSIYYKFFKEYGNKTTD